MKTLTDFKKRLTKGVLLKGVRHGFMGKVDIELPIRPVEKIQTNSFALLGSNNTLSWCEFPTAKRCIFYPDNPNKISIFIESNGVKHLLLTYEFV